MRASPNELTALPAQINAEHQAAQQCAETAVQHAVRCGQLLLEAKAGLRHGEFMLWIGAHCQFSQATANNYMRAAQNPNALGNSIRHLFPSGSTAAAETRKRERIAEIDRQRDELSQARPEAPLGLFNVLVMDPPWPYAENIDVSGYDPVGHRASNPYPEMPLVEIASISLPAAPDCVLWLWTTHRFMRHAFPLLDAWGFEEKAIVTWAKDRMGLGRWLRSQSEFCIMAVRGQPVISLTNQTTVLQGPMREHSRKPDEFYTMVDGLCHGRKLDYFSREKREGWEQFGNDLERFAA